jgi:predicted dinucleotide-binding enzyme
MATTSSKTRIGIVGDGNVGSALRRGLERAGHDVRAVGKDPAAVKEVGTWAEIVVLAVPFGAIGDAVATLGSALDGKVLVDVTNALTDDMQLALGCTTSGAEELQKKAPRAKVVKAFNTVFAGTMDSGRVAGQQLTVFAAGDDAGARQRVLALERDIGFDGVDAGPLRNARWLETLGYFNIQLGYVVGLGTEMGFKLVHP